MKRSLSILGAIGAVLMLSFVVAPAPAHAAVVDRRCSSEVPVGGGAKMAMCVQRDNLGRLNAVASVVIPKSGASRLVTAALEECSASGCSVLPFPGQAWVEPGHGFVASSIVPGVPGHWYYGRGFIDFRDGEIDSPSIPIPCPC